MKECIRVSEDEFKIDVPHGESVWIEVGKLSLYVRHNDEGYAVDAYRLGHENEEALGGTWVLHSELEDE